MKLRRVKKDPMARRSSGILSNHYFTLSVKAVFFLAALAVLLFTGEVAAVEALYKARIHKNFVKEVISRNLPVILKKLEASNEHDVYLTAVNANVNDLNLRILPKDQSTWQESQDPSIFFDKDEVMMSLAGLEFVGSGMITDPETNVQEQIHLRADLEELQILMKLSTEEEDTSIYPKVELVSTKMSLIPDTIQIDARGDLPLYKAHQFEEAVKEWFQLSLQKRQAQFLSKLQQAEREIISSFAYKKNISVSKKIDNVMGKQAVAHSSLAKKMHLSEDHLFVDFKTQFEGRNLAAIRQKLRKVKPVYSEDSEHQRDVQIIIDENQINYFLYTLFLGERPFSLAEVITSFIPDQFAIAGPMLKQMLNTQVLSILFPDLSKYGNRKADLRCSLSENELKKGRIKGDISTIHLKDGDRVESDLHFGCSIMVYGDDNDKVESDQAKQVEEIFNVFSTFMGIDDQRKWKTYRKFYISINTKVKLDFSKHQERQVPAQKYIDQFGSAIGFGEDILQQYKLTQILPFIFGKVAEFDPVVKELKVFKEDKELFDEADYMNQKIYKMRDDDFWNDPIIKPVIEFIFGHAIPVAPFPNVERCLGVKPRESSMTIKDGYAVMSFDYNVKEASEECLFRLKEWKEENKNSKSAFSLKKLHETVQNIPGTEQASNLAKKGFKKIVEKQDPAIKDAVKNVMNVLQDEDMKKGLNDIGKVFKNRENLGSLGDFMGSLFQ